MTTTIGPGAARAFVASPQIMGNREGDSRSGTDRGVMPQILVIVEVHSFRAVKQIVTSYHRSLKMWR